MPKFHISKRTGTVVECKAGVGRCPFATDAEHFLTEKEGRAAYEKKMKSEELPSFQKGLLKVTSLPTDTQLSGLSVLVSKGVYVVGDLEEPIAANDPESWSKINATITRDSQNKAIAGASVNSYPVISMSTKYGDGIYFDNVGRDYPVDNGKIMLTPLSLVKKIGITDEMLDRSNVKIVTFDSPTKITYENGTLLLGNNLQIFTDVEPVDDPEQIDPGVYLPEIDQF